jgi:hypothetical protein
VGALCASPGIVSRTFLHGAKLQNFASHAEQKDTASNQICRKYNSFDGVVDGAMINVSKGLDVHVKLT